MISVIDGMGQGSQIQRIDWQQPLPEVNGVEVSMGDTIWVKWVKRYKLSFFLLLKYIKSTFVKITEFPMKSLIQCQGEN